MLRLITHQAPTLMNVMPPAPQALAHWDPDVNDNSHDANLRKAERLLAQLPVVLAARHRLRQGKEPVAADKHRSLADNLRYPDAHPPRAEPASRPGDGDVASALCRA